MRTECGGAWLSALVDGELHGWQRWQAERHVRHCPRCEAEHAALQGLALQLERAAPLERVVRVPSRPLGIVRPLAALAVASGLGVGALWRPAPVPTPSPVAKASPTPQLERPTAPPVRVAQVTAAKATPPASVERPRRKRRRHQPHVTPKRVAPVSPEIIVVATAPAVVQPRTQVIQETDADGGSIYIEATTPAAYVAAEQRLVALGQSKEDTQQL